MPSSSTALDRRWTQLCRSQQLARRAAIKRAGSSPMDALKEKIPHKVKEKLEWAFCKGFGAVFEYGDAVIEKTIDAKGERRRFIARDLSFIMEGSSASLSSFEVSGVKSDGLNMLLTTVEGVGLGALGIGMPDIVLFVAMLRRGVREAAAQYGRDAERESEKMLILYMLEAAMLSGEDWVERDNLVERMLSDPSLIPENPEAAEEQLERTAAVFATDLLVMKFIQGLPVVGLVGGLSNPFYYRKVLSYVRLKYERSYIRETMGRQEEISAISPL